MKPIKAIHFIGIKGVGMSALAIVAKGLGYEVTGSDTEEEFITDKPLREAGIESQVGFRAEHITSTLDLVVVGAAYGEDDPEVAQARELNITTWPYSQFLGYLSEQKKTIAIAGTHGKTTTTSLTAYLLMKAGLDPSYVIGTASVAGLPAHGHAGRSEYFVVEADDYKRSPSDETPKFLDLSPSYAIITSIEHDHPDMYPTLADCVEAFRQFIGRVEPSGLLIINSDDPEIQKLASEFTERTVISYGFDEQADYRIITSGSAGETAFRLEHKGVSIGPFMTKLNGLHNSYNATAAIILALALGISEEVIKQELADFSAVERRYQLLRSNSQQTVIDDYAHHPTAIQFTLRTVKAQFPDRPIWCIFQPHTYSRTKALLPAFATAFRDIMASSDQVIITDIYGSARERDVTITAQDLVAEIKKNQPNVRYVAHADLLSYLDNLPKEGVLITMGAGDIYKVGRAIVARH